MRPLTLLVTNDDGHQSPILPYFLDVLSEQSWCEELRTVIPAREQSWISTAITRFEPLTATPGEVGKHKALFVTGTPADCASLAIFNLYPTKPDFVFSGINIGANAGLAFFLSSGTVGGAVEGFLSQVPSLALSVSIPSEVFQLWFKKQWSALEELASTWRRVSEVAVTVALELLRTNAWKSCDIISVNLPWDVTPTTPRVITTLESTRYKPLFIREGDLFIHRMQGLEHMPEQTARHAPSDISVLNRDEISITPIRFGGLSLGSLE